MTSPPEIPALPKTGIDDYKIAEVADNPAATEGRAAIDAAQMESLTKRLGGSLPESPAVFRPVKLARSHMRAYAQRLWVQQGGLCPLCQLPIDLRVKGEGVIDHAHDTGYIRGLLHRSCNGSLGKLDNAVGRWGAKSMNYGAIIAYLERVLAYYKKEPHPHIYPFHKTDEELRVERLRKRRVSAAATRARAKLKAAE